MERMKDVTHAAAANLRVVVVIDASYVGGVVHQALNASKLLQLQFGGYFVEV